MRFARGLTETERWDLGLMLALLTVACLCFGVYWNYRSIPALFALDYDKNSNVSVQPAQPLILQLDPLPTAPTVGSLPSTNGAALTSASSVQPPRRYTGGQLTSFIQPLPSAAGKAKKAIAYQWFNGQRYRYWKTVRMHVTAYAPDRRCCWPFDGSTTASGYSVNTNHGKLVAADTHLIPMHALVSVPGYHKGQPVPVLDRGGAIKGQRLDVLMPSFGQAQDWGAQDINVKVYLPVD